MDERNLLAERFEAHRVRLRGVAYRMLGSATEADDAVQEAWLRLSRAGTDDIVNLGAWLTTVVARVCLDVLRSRKARREESLEGPAAEVVDEIASESDRSTKPCWPIRSASRCWSCWRHSPRPSASLWCCTTCSTSRSRKSRPLSAVHPSPRGSPRAARGGACKARR
jgi:RNA polymerase sigma factor (sigma-70 family)